jgi:Bardet-Biedl syndrome 9 protein
MSLFKSREWWSTNCGIDETFGAFHMCVADYESVINGVVKQIIIVGSLEGYLRIYDPQPQSSSADENSCSSDLQLETQLALPVLAVLSGRFNK